MLCDIGTVDDRVHSVSVGKGEKVHAQKKDVTHSFTPSDSVASSVSKQLVKQFERALTTSAMGRFDALVKQIPKVGRRRESLSGQCWWMLFLVVHALILCSIRDVVEVVCLCVCVVCVCVVCVCVVCVCVCVCACI